MLIIASHQIRRVVRNLGLILLREPGDNRRLQGSARDSRQ